jgi:hypothetical protein
VNGQSSERVGMLGWAIPQRTNSRAAAFGRLFVDAFGRSFNNGGLSVEEFAVGHSKVTIVGDVIRPRLGILRRLEWRSTGRRFFHSAELIGVAPALQAQAIASPAARLRDKSVWRMDPLCDHAGRR